MQTQNANWIQYGTGILAAFLVMSLFAGWFETEPQAMPTFPTAEEIANKVIVPMVEAPDNEKIDEIHVIVLKDDGWEDEAEAMATEEWAENDNKDLYRAINRIYGDLDDEDDIIYVREDESTDFEAMDADDKDGIVVQYLKVKYEDENGDDKKRYLTVVTEFDDGDLEEQEITRT